MINKLFGLFFRLFYKKYVFRGYGKSELLRVFFFQKIIGYNRRASWPVHWSSRIDAPERIVFESGCPGYMPGCYIDARNGIELGKNLIIGPNVNIVSQNHDLCSFDKYIGAKPIRIGKNSWLGAGCVILPEVELGEHTIVAAGAIVTKSFLDKNVVIAGNPARVIKTIEPYSE